jgi:hypothetical protein
MVEPKSMYRAALSLFAKSVDEMRVLERLYALRSGMTVDVLDDMSQRAFERLKGRGFVEGDFPKGRLTRYGGNLIEGGPLLLKFYERRNETVNALELNGEHITVEKAFRCLQVEGLIDGVFPNAMITQRGIDIVNPSHEQDHADAIVRSPADVQVSKPLLMLSLWITVAIGMALIGSGITLVWLGAQGNTEISSVWKLV